MLVRLVYFSRSTRDMTLLDIQKILEVARDNNNALQICGMLCYEQRYFLQALEGERDVVNELYLDIAGDPRHDEVTIISYNEVEDRWFGAWNMGFAPASDDFYALLSELGKNEFRPADFTPEQAFSLLMKLSEQQGT